MDARVIAMVAEMESPRWTRPRKSACWRGSTPCSGNPYAVVEAGFETFRQKIKQEVKRVRESTLKELWTQAQQPTRFFMPAEQRKMLEGRLRQFWEDVKRHEARKEEIATRMGELFRQLNRKDEAPDRIGSLDAAMMGRLIGESGPLSDHCPDYRRGLTTGGRSFTTAD
ncbi:hypothetical protein [Salinibacter ruber]|uniref:hypothetical protein n=1 Tax=Salinibacter ruber TaxID=146919 RepID=UPI0021697141|nr:hypothetical protein [Salinibacter ruber]MCS4197184.1 hypothetical protein [Salinibacter ruber]